MFILVILLSNKTSFQNKIKTNPSCVVFNQLIIGTLFNKIVTILLILIIKLFKKLNSNNHKIYHCNNNYKNK